MISSNYGLICHVKLSKWSAVKVNSVKDLHFKTKVQFSASNEFK